MTSTALERTDSRPPVSLFPGTTAGEIIATATDVANQFSDIVKQRRMFKRIGESDHIQIEAWQTIGALTGVAAVEAAGVDELPWPQLGDPGEEPPAPSREPRERDTPAWREWKQADATRSAWELLTAQHRSKATGHAFGFKASFRAVKGGTEVGWGEGRCTRAEPSKTHQEDYALSSMAQTRAQSRALGAPLRFVVKLAGYEGASAEEMDGTAPAAAAAATPAMPWGPLADDEGMETAAKAIRAIRADLEGEQFILAMGQYFDGVPESCVVMLRGLARLARSAGAKTEARDASTENQPPDPAQSAYHNPPVDPGV